MRSSSGCRSGNPSVMFFESISISDEAPRWLIPGSLLHACEQCSIANNGNTNLERERSTQHKAQETAHRSSICDDANIPKVKFWLTILNSMDQSLQWRSRCPVGILINISTSGVWFQDWICLRWIPDWGTPSIITYSQQPILSTICMRLTWH